MATSKRKAGVRQPAPVYREEAAPPSSGIALSPATVKWIVGFLAATFAAVVGYWQIADRVDSHWRLEQVQQAKDKEAEAKEKQLHAEISAVSKKAEVGRAWVLWSVQDTKAYTAAQFARVCHALKLPPDECARQDTDAQAFRVDAADAKRQAAEAGKGP